MDQSKERTKEQNQDFGLKLILKGGVITSCLSIYISHIFGTVTF